MAFLSLTAIVVTFASALLLLTFILSSSLNGYGAANVFAYHAAFMVVGFVLLMPLSALSYKLDCGSRGNSVYPSRDSRRVLHGTLGLLAALFVLLGYMVAFVYHQAQGKPHMPFSEPATNSPTARSAHVVIGLIAIGCTLLQVVMGLYKFVQLEKVDVKVFSSLHGACPLPRRSPTCRSPILSHSLSHTHTRTPAQCAPTARQSRSAPWPPRVAAGAAVHLPRGVL